MYYVYVLISRKTGRYYVGSTGNLEDRFNRHNAGRSRFTKSERPWDLYYKEVYATRREALKREKEIKSWIRPPGYSPFYEV